VPEQKTAAAALVSGGRCVAGASGQERVSARSLDNWVIQGKTRASRGGSRGSGRSRCQRCKTRTLAVLSARTPGARAYASGIYRDPTKMKINRVMLVWMVRMMDMLSRPEDQVSNVV
jgi:hypothetical protein